VEISATGLRAAARVRRRYVINGYAIRSPIRERVRISDVCQAMRDEFWQDGGDMILEEPDRLTIRYLVPRPNWPRKRAD